MASSFPERRSPSQRFLPPDPRVAEPYRFTPQLAIRVGVLGATRARRLRRALPPALGVAGALRRPLPARRAAEPGPHGAGGGRPRHDPRPLRQDARLERARHGREDLDRRPARRGPLRDVQAAFEDPPRAAAAADEGARGAQGRSAHADPREDGRARVPGRVPLGAPRRSSRASRSSAPISATTSTARSPRSSSATSARSRRRSSSSASATTTAAATRSARPAWRRPSTSLPARDRRNGADPGRLARTAAGADRAAQGGAARLQRPADDRRRSAAGRRARAPARDRAREGETSVERERRRDRRNRPA